MKKRNSKNDEFANIASGGAVIQTEESSKSRSTYDLALEIHVILHDYDKSMTTEEQYYVDQYPKWDIVSIECNPKELNKLVKDREILVPYLGKYFDFNDLMKASNSLCFPDKYPATMPENVLGAIDGLMNIYNNEVYDYNYSNRIIHWYKHDIKLKFSFDQVRLVVNKTENKSTVIDSKIEL